MYVSAIAYGNWATHGEQIGQDAATACVRTALDLGITAFDPADAYAATTAESALGEALEGVPRASVESSPRSTLMVFRRLTARPRS